MIFSSWWVGISSLFRQSLIYNIFLCKYLSNGKSIKVSCFQVNPLPLHDFLSVHRMLYIKATSKSETVKSKAKSNRVPDGFGG